MTDAMNSTSDEFTAALFHADILAPAEYFEICRRKTEVEPETRLMLAVLVDAIAVYQDYISQRRRVKKSRFQEAEEWITAENRDWPFSFENICEALGFNPQYIRFGLQRWKERRQRARKGLIV